MSSTKTKGLAKRVETAIEAMKAQLAKEIASSIEDLGMTQQQAAYAMADAPSQVSLVVTGKLRGFSMERLLRMRALLGAEITMTIKSAAVPKVHLKVA